MGNILERGWRPFDTINFSVSYARGNLIPHAAVFSPDMRSSLVRLNGPIIMDVTSGELTRSSLFLDQTRSSYLSMIPAGLCLLRCAHTYTPIRPIYGSFGLVWFQYVLAPRISLYRCRGYANMIILSCPQPSFVFLVMPSPMYSLSPRPWSPRPS
jgi:hypothetical protein